MATNDLVSLLYPLFFSFIMNIAYSFQYLKDSFLFLAVANPSDGRGVLLEFDESGELESVRQYDSPQIITNNFQYFLQAGYSGANVDDKEFNILMDRVGVRSLFGNELSDLALSSFVSLKDKIVLKSKETVSS